MIKKYILALDEGTTSARAILFDKDFNIKLKIFKKMQKTLKIVQKLFSRFYKRP